MSGPVFWAPLCLQTATQKYGQISEYVSVKKYNIKMNIFLLGGCNPNVSWRTHYYIRVSLICPLCDYVLYRRCTYVWGMGTP